MGRLVRSLVHVRINLSPGTVNRTFGSNTTQILKCIPYHSFSRYKICVLKMLQNWTENIFWELVKRMSWKVNISFDQCFPSLQNIIKKKSICHHTLYVYWRLQAAPKGNFKSWWQDISFKEIMELTFLDIHGLCQQWKCLSLFEDKTTILCIKYVSKFCFIC